MSSQASPPRTTNAVREALSDVAFAVFWVTFGWFLRLWFGVHAHGRPTLRGPCILAPNHTSFLDPLVLNACVPRRIVFLMTTAFYDLPWLRWFFRWTGTIPVQESRGNHDMIRRTLVALGQGHAVAIFPEGGISRDGKLMAGNPGMAALVLRARVPVVPVSIEGTFEAMSRHARWPRPASVRVRFGEPIPPEAWDAATGVNRKARLRQVTERVMAEIGRLQQG